jgi:hypothetical protein
MDEHEDGYADPYLDEDDYLDDIWADDERNYFDVLRDYDDFGDYDELNYDEDGYCDCEWCEGHYE